MSLLPGGHTLKRFDEQLGVLRDLVIQMGGVVEDQLAKAMHALASGDSRLADSVVQSDRQVDRFELRADEETAQLLALRTPLGVDLRTVLGLSKTVNDLERVGDETKKIARIALKLQRLQDGHGARAVPLLEDIERMSRAVAAVLRGAMDALARLDLSQAQWVLDQDAQVDLAYKALLTRLTALMMEMPEQVPSAVQVIFAVKGLERIGDHAKNIAEYVFYVVEGRDVRHPKAQAAG
ncbi:MAG: Phosphate-specific transport system accessory protein PhoU [Alphaproteobacteria bacterium ADurb.BinA280]|jgi:phosphate transport system protein|nr:MAG: Phosphate-specific transport system accessory protein PhoU [Alphaproteobacteria bacterium ADurb.BinA280]